MSLFIGDAHIALIFRHELDPDPWMTTFGMIAQPEPDRAAMADQCAQAWVDNIKAATSQQVTLISVRCTFGVTNMDADPVIIETPVNIAGSNSEQMLPQNCALLVTKITAAGGKSGKGRFFWPGLLADVDVNAVGSILPTTVTARQAEFTAFLEDLSAGADGPSMVVFAGSLSDPGPPGRNIVTDLQVSPTISTQRRRLR